MFAHNQFWRITTPVQRGASITSPTNCFGFHQYVFTLKFDTGAAYEPTAAIFYDEQMYIQTIVDAADKELWRFTLQDFVAKADEAEKDCLDDLVIATAD